MSKWDEAECKWLVDWEIKSHPICPQQEEQRPTTTWDFVCTDITEREQMGFKKYGKYLTPGTDENMLQHLYEELLDATVYIKTLILQQNGKVPK